MPRSPIIATPPPGTTPQQPNTVIQSSVWNAAIDDIYNLFNSPQPIEYGGTGANNVTTARANLGLNLYDSPTALTDAQEGQARANIGAGVMAGFRNKIINPDFEVNRKGPGPFTNGHALDRWLLNPGSGASVGIQRAPEGDLPWGRGFYVLWSRSVAGSAASTYVQRIEGAKTLAGKTATLTFWASCSADTVLRTSLRQYFGSGGSPSADVTSTVVTHNITATHQKFNVVVPLASVVGKTFGTNLDDFLELIFQRNNADANPLALVYISHVSLVEGDATAEADPLSPRPFQEEERLCMRYGQRRTSTTRGAIGTGLAYTTTQVAAFIDLPVRMARNPTLTSSNLSVTNGSGTSIAGTSSSVTFFAGDSLNLIVGVAGGLTVGQASLVSAGSGAGGWLDLDAEI